MKKSCRDNTKQTGRPYLNCGPKHKKELKDILKTYGQK